jgi:site-specific recombinase XerC
MGLEPRRPWSLAVPTKKPHLAALRDWSDRLVDRRVVPINPAATVRAGRSAMVEGKTTEIRPEQVATLLRPIDIATTVGLRDPAVLAILAFTAARIGAVAWLAFKGLRDDATPCGEQMHANP